MRSGPRGEGTGRKESAAARQVACRARSCKVVCEFFLALFPERIRDGDQGNDCRAKAPIVQLEKRVSADQQVFPRVQAHTRRSAGDGVVPGRRANQCRSNIVGVRRRGNATSGRVRSVAFS